MHDKRAVSVAWLTSGAYRKSTPNPDFVLAWAELVSRQPYKTNATIDGEPTALLRKMVKELPKTERGPVAEIIEARKYAHLYI